MIHTGIFWTLLLSTALFAAILLGDARQSVVDVFMAGTAIAGHFALWRTSGFRKLPKAAVVLWAATLIVAIPLVWFDGIGAATQNFTRYLFGFMVFGLAYSVATRRAASILERALLVVGVAVSVFTVVFLFVPQPSWLPLMNLLYPSYGHNHAADVLLFVLPIVLYSREIPGKLRTVLWIVLLGGLVFSFARGAWVLVALFGVCVTALTGQKKKKLLLSTLVLAAALVLVGVAATNKWTKNISGRLVDAPAFHRVINKGNPANDPRFEYWTQALKMIKERPVLGSGPGSFYFGSRRLQSQPSSYSWFAHSFALQILAEQGVVGALPALFLFGWVLWHIARFVPHHPPEHDPLSRLGIGVLLTAVYSFIEFNLSFAVVWALFWAITGLILGAEKTHNDHKAKDGRQLAPALLLLTAFYVVFIGQSAIFVLFPKRADVVFYLTPFDAITAQYYLASDVVSPRGIITATAFHKADTETLQGVAEAWAKLGFINESINVRRRILSLDPLIEENHNEYLDGLVQMGRFNEVSAWFDRYPGYFFPAYLGRHVVSVPSLYIQEFPQEHRKLFESKYSHEVRYSRFYYNVGLWYLSTEPEKTRALWELSSLLQPKLSYLWLERASLEQQVFGDRSAADNLFLGCLNNPSAAAHCKETRDLQQVFPPGHYKAAINEK